MKHSIHTLIFIFSSVVITSLLAGSASPPKLTFFCEVDLDTIPFVSDHATLKALVSLNATVSVAIRDLSTERANFIRTLNQNNISTSAWLVVNHTEGYWANINNANDFVAMYKRFQVWTHQYGLKWEAIGLDLEIDFKEITMLANLQFSKFFSEVKYRLEHPQVLADAKATYASLVSRIKSDGYRVESYIFPFIYDERKANSQLLERLLGLVDVTSVDIEIPMLYTSGLPFGIGFLKSYGSGLPAVAVGTTGGDPMNSSIPTTYGAWEELEQDLLYAYQYLTPNIYVYSLPGTIERGWLQKIVSLNWNKELTYAQLKSYDIKAVLVDTFRTTLQALLAPSSPKEDSSNYVIM
eukprot:TRINITY_DN8765_c0_g1_i1.p1 TRINITY_DN8765_c0_g1~~TRINITY_DN8765_c0_g1_i1.p1  ORF type:complete len:359 (-),score=57.50 TRINITY_DN8765_c0_g1_i1:11-1066(-)